MLDIIPYNSWINSQLSIARHYWQIEMNWKTYIVDYIFCETEDNGKCKPDLVEQKLYMKMKKERKEEVKTYYEEWKKQLEHNNENQEILF